MKSSMRLALLALSIVVVCGGLTMAQAPETIKAAQKVTAELSAAERACMAATNGLEGATRSLDPQVFNSPAWNARVSAEQLKNAKDRYEKARPNEKDDALENYELAMELAGKRKAELEAAEKALPEREAAVKAAEEKHAAVLPAANKMADSLRSLVREAEIDLTDKVQVAKLAIEKAAFAKATADKTAQSNAMISKAMAELTAADKAVQEASAALAKASADKALAKRLAEAEKVTQLYAAALQAVVKHIPALQTGQAMYEIEFQAEFRGLTPQHIPSDKTAQANAVVLKVTADLVAADKAVKDTAAALQKAKNEVQNRTNAAKAAADRARDAQAAVDKAVAKIAAKRTAKSAQDAAAKAEASKQEAEKVIGPVADAAEKATKVYAAALQTAVENLVKNPAKSLVAERTAIARAMAAKEAEIKKQNEAAAREAGAAKTEADKADAARAAADKVVVERTAARQALEQAIRERFYRAIRAEHTELVKLEAAVNASEKALPTRTAALKTATAGARQAKSAADKARAEAAAAHAVWAKITTKDKEAAEKAAQKKEAAAKAAEQKVSQAQAAVDKAAADKAAIEQTIKQQQVSLQAARSKLAVAKAAAQGGLKALPESAWDYVKARHLLVRAGFGGTPDEVARLHALGSQGAVDYLVNFQAQPPADIAFTVFPAERPRAYEAKLTGEQRNQLRRRRQQKEAQQIQNMRTWWLRRMIESPRPLEEKLTLFWHGHFAVQYSTAANSYYMYLQNQFFRDNACGNFATLLHGIAHDAAMLNYLNNDTNVKGRPNENLAREIMELFSMGRDQGYSEIDIRQGARALTGYTYDSASGQFRFIEARHDEEPKTIFGKTGNWCGDDFADLILETPYPSKFIARQLFKFFAHDEPTIDTIEALANVLRLNNYELAPMLENLFASEEFYSPKAMGTQIKGPIQLVVGLHRDLGLKDANLPYLVTATSRMGQQLFEPPSVFGWPSGRAWINSTRVFVRYNALVDIVESMPRGGKTGVDVVGTLLAGKNLQSHAEVLDYLTRCCLTIPLPEAKRQALIEFLSPLPLPAQWAAQPGPVNARLTRLLAILMCSPEFQLT